jgi:quinol monooxygenase YgiN
MADAIQVVARITAKADKVEALKSVLLALVAPTRAEPGCVSYQLCQNRSDPTDFVFVEAWASEAAIDGHMKTAHVGDALAQAQSLLASPPDIRSYTLLG